MSDTQIASLEGALASARGALERISKATPGHMNARSAQELSASVRAIAIGEMERQGDFDARTPAPSTIDRALFDEMVEALAASQKAIRELREFGAPHAFWDDVEAANIAVLAKAREAGK
jgi:hypothetical protein